MNRPTEDLVKAFQKLNLVGQGVEPRWSAMAGGVSSDIWRVDLGERVVCVKRALPRLKVAAEWFAPIERNAFEVAWMKTVAGIVPDSVVPLIADDAEAGMFVMAFLDPGEYRLWKTELLHGHVDTAVAREVGDRLGRIHAGTADDAKLARRFATDETFHALRLEPYLEATARMHGALAEQLQELVQVTGSTKRVLVHGDVSPKNIVVGPHGPVFLDAECAWYGDPAFDLAFCLNHLLLKCLHTPSATEGFLSAFDTLCGAYFDHVTWEPVSRLNERTARLLPGLMLARVDGKSPVEYVTETRDKEHVRKVAAELLRNPAQALQEVKESWKEELFK